MTDARRVRHAVLTMLGGLVWTVVLGVDDVAPGYVGVAVLAPALVGFGVLEVHDRYGDRYGTTGRGGVILTALGLGALLVAVVVYAVLRTGLALYLLVGLPLVVGAVALGVGSALLAVALRRLGVLSLPAALLLGLGVPFVPVAGAALAAAVGPTGYVPLFPGGVATGFSGVPYGLGWAALGYRLLETADAPRTGRDDAMGGDVTGASNREATGRPRSPHRPVVALVGVALTLLGAARFLPLGPLSGTPWVNQSLALDVFHLATGVAGLAVAGTRDGRLAGRYARLVGASYLLLGVGWLPLLALRSADPIRRLVLGALRLNLPDALLHLPVGLVLVALGFLVDVEGDA